MRSILNLTLGSLLIVGFILIAWFKGPHIGLYLLIHSARLDAEPTPVVQFSAPSIDRDVVFVAVGALSLELPRSAWSPETREGLRQGVLRASSDGMDFCVATPRAEGLPPLRDILEPEFRALFKDEIALEIASYRARPKNLAIGMSRDEVRCLRQLLEVRRSLWTQVDRIEIVRNQKFHGVLAIQPARDGRVRMRLDYQSVDGALSGTACFSLAEGSPRAMDTARAIISSIRIKGTSSCDPVHAG